jgi:hypothetical protein
LVFKQGRLITIRSWLAADDMLIQELNPLIQFLATLAVADYSDLGFDESVKRVLVGGLVQYRFTVGDKEYVTLSVLADYRANTITGRGTRVWVVKLFGDKSGRTYVLKDAWIGENDTPEGIKMKLIRRNIRRWIARNHDGPKADDISREYSTWEERIEEPDLSNSESQDLWDPEEDQEENRKAPYNKYFLTPVIHCFVPPSSGSTGKDRTHAMACLIGEDFFDGSISETSTSQRSSGSRPFSQSNRSQVVGAIPGPEPHRANEATHVRRLVHYRIVFQEVGTTFHDLSSTGSIFAALRDAAIGML